MAIKPTDCTIRLVGIPASHRTGDIDELVWPRYWEQFQNHINQRTKAEFDAAKDEYFRKNPRAPRWRNPISYSEIYERIQQEEYNKYRFEMINDRKHRTWLKFQTHGDLSYFMIVWS